jgi:hypothetical protein
MSGGVEGRSREAPPIPISAQLDKLEIAPEEQLLFDARGSARPIRY